MDGTLFECNDADVVADLDDLELFDDGGIIMPRASAKLVPIELSNSNSFVSAATAAAATTISVFGFFDGVLSDLDLLLLLLLRLLLDDSCFLFDDAS